MNSLGLLALILAIFSIVVTIKYVNSYNNLDKNLDKIKREVSLFDNLLEGFRNFFEKSNNIIKEIINLSESKFSISIFSGIKEAKSKLDILPSKSFLSSQTLLIAIFSPKYWELFKII